MGIHIDWSGIGCCKGGVSRHRRFYGPEKGDHRDQGLRSEYSMTGETQGTGTRSRKA